MIGIASGDNRCVWPASGELVKAVKEGLSQLHDRDTLMTTAFDRVGSMPGRRIEGMRAVHR